MVKRTKVTESDDVERALATLSILQLFSSLEQRWIVNKAPLITIKSSVTFQTVIRGYYHAVHMPGA